MSTLRLIVALALVVLSLPAGASAPDIPLAGLTPLSPGAVELHTGFPQAASIAAGKSKSKPFTRDQKRVIKQENADAHGGRNQCEGCGTETVEPQRHEKGVSPPLNETHVDHKIPQAKGGPAEIDNGQVLCRDCNLKKSDKLPAQEPKLQEPKLQEPKPQEPKPQEPKPQEPKPQEPKP